MQESDFECTNCINDPNSIFNILPKNEQDDLVVGHTCIFYKKGDYIYHERDKPNGLLYLTKGKVKIFKEGVKTALINKLFTLLVIHKIYILISFTLIFPRF